MFLGGGQGRWFLPFAVADHCADFAALISGTKEGNGADIFMKSCFNSSDADARFPTSISRHWHRKSLNVSERASGFWSSGVPFVAIR